ncbi:recombinase-like helix-turn-helix domain-containing protein [Enterobacter ludwigii]|uniref:recombinase-like helix-turn-helix domain-containing protein n=1 Tax=Enterobacter ludwigii TaxID=299767 RepID=UPI003976EFF4
MSESLNFNPALPESRQFTPPAEGGNGAIHKPGYYQNLIWQTRSRVPENWEITLISTLEDLFEQGAETVPELVNGLNAVRMHDQQGEPWSDASFQAFLQVNGY